MGKIDRHLFGDVAMETDIEAARKILNTRGHALEQPYVTCEICGNRHDASVKFGGVTIIACPEVPEGTLIPSSVDFQKMLDKAGARQTVAEFVNEQTSQMFRDFNKSPYCPPMAHERHYDLADFPMPQQPIIISERLWVCANHLEPITYTGGTETCYCGEKRNAD